MCSKVNIINKLFNRITTQENGDFPTPKRKHIDEDVKFDEKKPKLEETSNLTYSKQTVLWPKADILFLLERIQNQLPNDEEFNYNISLDKIKWKHVAFESYSAKECEEVTNILLRKTRKFRLLSELLDDVKDWLMHATSTQNINAVTNLSTNRINKFWYFFAEKYPKLKQENPKLSNEQIEYKLLKEFNELSVNEQRKYGENEECNFTKQEKRKKEVASMLPPRKPRTAYRIFCDVESPNYPKSSSMMQNWRQLSDKSKYFYIKWADEEQEVYDANLKKYLAVNPDYTPPKLNRPIFVDEAIKERAFHKPEVPPRGPFFLFNKIYKTIVPPVKGPFTPFEVWKSFTSEEQERFRLGCEVMWNEYERKFEEYLMNFPPEERIYLKTTEGQFLKRPKPTKKTERMERNKKLREKIDKYDVFVKPMPPPTSAYKLFARKYKGEGNPREIWGNLSEIDKQEYQSQLDQLKQQYTTDLMFYLEKLPRGEISKIGPNLKLEDDSDISASEDEI